MSSRPTSKTSGGRKDQRRHERRRAELSISVSTVDGPKVRGQLSFDSADLSEGGAFLCSDLLLEEGELINVEIALAGHAIRATARVVRTARTTGGQAGMGIEFIRLSDSDRKTLSFGLMTLSAASS